MKRSPTLSEDDLEELVEKRGGIGTWVREVYDGADEWHRSIAFDGEDGIHYLGCGYGIMAQTRVEDVERDLDERPDGEVCAACEEFWELEEGDR